MYSLPLSYEQLADKVVELQFSKQCVLPGLGSRERVRALIIAESLLAIIRESFIGAN
jgi:hypothetical protein